MPNPSVLLVSRRREVIETLSAGLTGSLEPLKVQDGTSLDVPGTARTYPLVVIDLASVPDGLGIGRRLRESNPSLEFLPIVEDDRRGVEALRSGAFDYLAWPPRDLAGFRMLLQSCLRNVDPAPSTVPEEVRGYVQLRRLGLGGMAEVFLARKPGYPEPVVLKCIRPEIANDPEFVEMFGAEAKISVQLKHPNIVSVLDVASDGSRLFIAMEYVEGRNLESIGAAASWKPPPALACYIMAEVCAGLAYAHDCAGPEGPLGIVHRDVNPPNILISTSGLVKLADFGIARTNQRFGQTASGVLKGKLDYMSPEQVAGEEIDRRSDVFSAGVVLFLMLAGRHPFASSTPLQTLQRIRAGGPPTPSLEFPGIPKELDALLSRALASSPGARYPNARELERDLRAIAARHGSPGRGELIAFVESLPREGSPVQAEQENRRPDGPRVTSLSSAPEKPPPAPLPMLSGSLPARPLPPGLLPRLELPQGATPPPSGGDDQGAATILTGPRRLAPAPMGAAPAGIAPAGTKTDLRPTKSSRWKFVLLLTGGVLAGIAAALFSARH